MKNENSFLHLLDLLKEAENKTNELALSSIEKDLLLSKIRRLYEHTITRPVSVKPESDDLHTKIHTTEKQQPPVSKEPAMPVAEAVVETETETIAPEKTAVIKETQVIPVPEPLAEPVAQPEPEKEPEIQEDVVAENPDTKTTAQNTEASHSTISDKFIGNHSQSIGEMMNQMRTQNDLTSKLKKRPVTNLKNAISINDRIMYTRELFGGNSDLFHDTIESMNKMEKLEEALEILTGKIELDTQNPQLEKFMELLYRRFVTTDQSLK